MIDVTTGKPLYISTDGTAGPYIMVPEIQLHDIQRLFDSHRVRYQVEEDVISINGAPAITVIDLGRGADARAVGAILDSVS